MNKKYIYVVNYPVEETELCKLEMRTIFGKEPEDKVLISSIKFNPSNSVFLKNRLEVVYEVDTFEEILTKLKENVIKVDDFKLEFIRAFQGDIKFTEKINYFNQIGILIDGIPNLREPKITLAIGMYKGKWLFGINENHDKKWNTREQKPCSYSNSLSVRVAKTMVNLASNGDVTKSIIDPCCGVGTTIVEGLAGGYNITGSELYIKNVSNGNKNLRFFDLEPIITAKDINDITEHYDGSIIDIPYGLFSHITKDLQQGIIDSAKRISNRMVLVTFEDLDYMVEKAGFKIVDRCEVAKGRFKRYILVCE